jgi:Zn-dependent alcohol dehydrogenase
MSLKKTGVVRVSIYFLICNFVESCVSCRYCKNYVRVLCIRFRKIIVTDCNINGK